MTQNPSNASPSDPLTLNDDHQNFIKKKFPLSKKKALLLAVVSGFGSSTITTWFKNYRHTNNEEGKRVQTLNPSNRRRSQNSLWRSTESKAKIDQNMLQRTSSALASLVLLLIGSIIGGGSQVTANGHLRHRHRHRSTSQNHHHHNIHSGHQHQQNHRQLDGNDSPKNTLRPSEHLRPNEWIQSNNGQYRLYMQNDGNLVLYKTSNNDYMWASRTPGVNNYLNMQSDGNLVLYTTSDVPVWATNTNGGQNKLIVHNNGVMTVEPVNGGSVLWTSENQSRPEDDGNEGGEGAGESGEDSENTNNNGNSGGGNSSGDVNYSSRGGVNRSPSRDPVRVTSTASPNDYEIVVIGGSSVGGGDGRPIDSDMMRNQQFQLIAARGTFDKKVEMWIRRKSSGSGTNSIQITGNGYHVAWCVVTIKGNKQRLDLGTIEHVSYEGNHGDGRSTAVMPMPSGNGLKLAGIFFDDSVEVTRAGNKGDIVFKDWGFGDGDGLAVILYQPGDAVPKVVNVHDHDPGTQGGEQHVNIGVNINVL